VGEAPPLREVIMNLLLNSVDALPEGGTITITTGAADGHVVCTVADTGVGMTDEVRRRAFEPFFTTKGPQNTGLGLSVAHGIAQRHHGELSIESEPGRGTVVTLRLPEADAATAPDAHAAPPTPSATPIKILLIDDEVLVRQALGDSLGVLGHTVVAAASGREGLERLESGERVDVVITDLGMPGMNGWDVVRVVQARWPDLPIGLVTGWAAGRELKPEEVARVAFVIGKPYTLATLDATLAPIRPRGSA
jgi:CheY-like chemotaxis protein/anti-sigma regulatory factor (Ser/Thr protein kinase)